MGLFGNETKHVDRFIDKLSMCPSCKHNNSNGVAGCGCRRNDCTCTHRNRKK